MSEPVKTALGVSFCLMLGLVGWLGFVPSKAEAG